MSSQQDKLFNELSEAAAHKTRKINELIGITEGASGTVMGFFDVLATIEALGRALTPFLAHVDDEDFDAFIDRLYNERKNCIAYLKAVPSQEGTA
jgi:hypothetical protein